MRILFLQKRLLFPNDTGGKIRTLNIVRHLAQWHEVTYLCNLQESERPFIDQMRSVGVDLHTVPWVEAPRRSVRFLTAAVMNLASPNPLNVDKDYDRRLRRAAIDLSQQRSFDLIICDFVQMARNCLGINCPKLLFQHNVEAEIFERLSKRSAGWWSRYLGWQAKKMRSFECRAGRDFDRIVAVSQRDEQQFRQRYGWDHVDVIDTAVDVDYFHPPKESRDVDQSPNVVFVGSMDWPPNIDGVQHFIRSIWPSVRQSHPMAVLKIVGRNPPRSITELSKLNGVHVTGTVPDTRSYTQQASVSIVPLYSGGGTRLKIFESMAVKCPVVSTPLGAEGLGLEDGKHLLIREDDNAFAEAICQLLTNAQQRSAIEKAAFDFVHQNFTTEKVARQFEQSCMRAIQSWRQHANALALS